MRTFVRTFVALFAGMTAVTAQAAETTKLLDRGVAIHSDTTIGTDGRFFDGTDYYASGNDDAFAEYGLSTFTFTSGDFGGEVLDITDITLTLTVNDRFFTDGDAFELFLTTDDFDATYTGLSYDSNVFNGLVQGEYSNFSTLGQFPFDEEAAGGTAVGLTLSLTAMQEAELISEINAGSEFSIGIVATDATHDITFTGFDDQFEMGGQPSLSITATAIPEPSAVALLCCVGGLVSLRRRR